MKTLALYALLAAAVWIAWKLFWAIDTARVFRRARKTHPLFFHGYAIAIREIRDWTAALFLCLALALSLI